MSIFDDEDSIFDGDDSDDAEGGDVVAAVQPDRRTPVEVAPPPQQPQQQQRQQQPQQQRQPPQRPYGPTNRFLDVIKTKDGRILVAVAIKSNNQKKLLEQYRNPTREELIYIQKFNDQVRQQRLGALPNANAGTNTTFAPAITPTAQAQGSSSGGGLNKMLIVGGVAVIAAAGYWFYQKSQVELGGRKPKINPAVEDDDLDDDSDDDSDE